MNRILKSYFYWTYPRGNFHYDVMVTLILLFIFVTPHLWEYGDRPSAARTFPRYPISVISDGEHGMVITVQAADVNAGLGDTDKSVKKALRVAVEPVAGDSVFVDRWELTRDANGSPLAWKVWAHR
jgi:hypothetical protein